MRPTGWLAGGLLALAACVFGDPPAGPGLPGAPPPPPAGKTTGNLTQAEVDETGGQLTLTGSQGDSLTVIVPPGAVPGATTFTLDEVSPNSALDPAGSAFRLGPAELQLAKALTLAFTPPNGTSVSSVTAAYQDGLGYWFRVYAVERDATEQKVLVQASRLGDWSLVDVATQRDLHGPVRLQSTQGEVPFTAEGNVVLQYVGEYDTDIVYIPTGSLEVISPVTYGSASCTPDAPNPYPLRPSIAEIHKSSPPRFRWGINGHWNLTCSDESRLFVSTNFDTLGITNRGCARDYVSAYTVEQEHLRGRYEIDCGAKGTVTAAWELVLPGETPGMLP